jgi:hypothetical protein
MPLPQQHAQIELRFRTQQAEQPRAAGGHVRAFADSAEDRAEERLRAHGVGPIAAMG